MSDGYTIRCRKCGYEFTAFLGIGMLFPVVYEETVSKIRKGKYGKEYKQFFEEHPNAAVNCENEAAVCTGCGRFECVKNLSLYLPKDENKKTGQGYKMACDLEEDYVKCMEYEHKCSVCRSPMKFIDLLEEMRNGKVSCPECGDEMELSGSLNWD